VAGQRRRRGHTAWRRRVIGWLRRDSAACATAKNDFDALGSAILVLISGEVIRPSLSWLLTPGTVQILTAEMARSRDREGFAELVSVCREDPANTHTKNSALCRIATIVAAKGGMVRDITAGDCVEMAELLLSGGGVDTSAYFYQLLHAMGAFPDAAPSTVRAVSGQAQGQISVEQMIDRYDIACRPVRDVLVDYLRVRQPSLDFTSLRALLFRLGKLLWKSWRPTTLESVRCAWRPTSRPRGNTGSHGRHSAARTPPGRSSRSSPCGRTEGSTIWRWCGPSTSTSRNGRWTTRPAGVCGPPRAPSGMRRCRRKRTAPTVSHVSTSGPVNVLPVLSTLAHTVDIERRGAAERRTAAQLVAPGAVFTAAG